MARAARLTLTNGHRGTVVLPAEHGTPPKCGRSDRWMFVLNNYTETEEEDISRLFDDKQKNIKYIVFGREIAPTTETPHLQGFVVFKSTYRPTLAGIIKLFNINRNGVNPVHFKISTCRNIVDAAEYCKKDGDFVQFGQLPEAPIQGKDAALLACIADMKAGMVNPKEIRSAYPGVYSKHRMLITELIQDYKVPFPVQKFPLRYWQSELNDILKKEANEREIIFVVDPIGNSGKTWFHRYYRDIHPDGAAQMIPNSNFLNMSFNLDPDIRVLFIDVRRSSDKIDYNLLEAVKDGEVDSNKYHPQIKRLDKVHVVVFTNHEPCMTSLSADRYVMIRVTEANNRTPPDLASNPEVRTYLEDATEVQTIVELNDDGDSVIQEMTIAFQREIIDLTDF
jgi:Putative viral replication protein